MVSTIVLSPTDAASQEAVVGSVQLVVVARARAPCDAALQHCLGYLDSEHPDFEVEGSARSVVRFEGVLPEASSCLGYAPIDPDRQVSIVLSTKIVKSNSKHFLNYSILKLRRVFVNLLSARNLVFGFKLGGVFPAGVRRTHPGSTNWLST